MDVTDADYADFADSQAVEHKETDDRLGLVATGCSCLKQQADLQLGDGAAAGIAAQGRALDAGRGRSSHSAALSEVVYNDRTAVSLRAMVAGA